MIKSYIYEPVNNKILSKENMPDEADLLTLKSCQKKTGIGKIHNLFFTPLEFDNNLKQTLFILC